MKENFSGLIKPGTPEQKLLDELAPERLPQHVAVIMDGNGRWAKMRGKPRIFGHRAGAESVRAILDTCARLGIKAVTLYAFSTENWKRPKSEISGLMQMLKRYLKSELAEVERNNIKFRAIGDLGGLEPEIQKQLDGAMKRTEHNSGTVMSVALNYGGRAEIVNACKAAVKELEDTGSSVSELTEDRVAAHLYTSGLPEVDLLIRTSGEFRISNFLLWQLAYSEIYVTPTLFPDFRLPQILEALLDYQRRERRFGDIK
jgi:undecaprenyl diphosphate synthase